MLQVDRQPSAGSENTWPPQRRADHVGPKWAEAPTEAEAGLPYPDAISERQVHLPCISSNAQPPSLSTAPEINFARPVASVDQILVYIADTETCHTDMDAYRVPRESAQRSFVLLSEKINSARSESDAHERQAFYHLALAPSRRRH